MLKVGTMFSDVLRSLFQRPATEQYPFERTEAPTRLRGHLNWNAEKCTGCRLCVKDCPSQAIELITIDKKAKQFVMRYHADRCTFCAQCVQNCRFECIEMASEDWELAALTKEPFTVYYGDDTDVAGVLASFTKADESEIEQTT
ncbi:MAG: 4Fe-4S dicluster domain-containing protein [Chloroflexi bacterium]|nr:4Fe-4S dicluster domain-containing protein [Chloroflexota bacterium]